MSNDYSGISNTPVLLLDLGHKTVHKSHASANITSKWMHREAELRAKEHHWRRTCTPWLQVLFFNGGVTLPEI